MASRHIIIGNGVAGVTTARTIAQARPGAEIHIFAAEPYPYYARPRLWEYLAGDITQEELYFYPDSWYQQRGIQVHLGRPVASLHPDRHEVTLADGAVMVYDRLALTTGGYSFVPPIEGVQKEGVFTLRDLRDALAMRAYAEGAHKAIAIGGGLLGLETARALAMLGLPVTVLELFPYLLPRQLDAQGADVLTNQIGGMGLTVVANAVSEAIEGEGRATGVRLKDGTVVEGDLILISAGMRSECTLARAAGLTVNRGVVVDDFLRTSAPDVYAVGDVAEHEGRVYGIIPSAIEQARVAGEHMAGAAPEPYRGTVPANTLKIVGCDVSSIGLINPEGEGFVELRRLDETRRCYKKFVLKDGRLVGAIMLGCKAGVPQVTRLIAQGADVSAFAGRMLDDDFDWKALS